MDNTHSGMDISMDVRLARKRTARACDQCRRRKSKCDGHTNCSACKAVGLSCSYGHSVKQARGPGYVAHLERKVEKLQSQNRRLSANQAPGDWPKDSPITVSSSPTMTDDLPPLEKVSSLSNSQRKASWSSRETGSIASLRSESTTSYIEIIAREPGAKSFGVDVLRQLCNLCYSLPPHGESHRQNPAMKIIQALDAPFPFDTVPSGPTKCPLLPRSDTLFLWVELAFSEALPLWEFVDKDSINAILAREWSSTEDQGAEDDLALLYSVLALGQRLEIGEKGPGERRLQGIELFAAARDIVPLSNCERSIPALQTVLCMALYLMAVSSPTKYHAYVSSAVSAALRMGLHEQPSGLSWHEKTLRHRLWLSIHALDVYASSALGLPSSFSPVDLHNQRERNQEILPDVDEVMPATSDSATAAYQQLARVLHSCLDRVYHDRESKAASVQTQVVASKSLREASGELETWGHGCAFISGQLGGLGFVINEDQLDGDYSAPFQQLSMCTRPQLLLCYAYCQAQLLLYTPLVHHLVRTDLDRASEGYLFGTRCVRAALAAVHVAEELKRRFQLNEGYFQTVDVLVNAFMVLLTIELGSADAKLLRVAIPAGRRAKDTLLALAPLSIKATDCWQALAPLYQGGKREYVKPRTKRKNVDVREDFSFRALDADMNGVNPVHIWVESSVLNEEVAPVFQPRLPCAEY